MRVQIAAAVTKAATARFVQDDVDNSLPFILYERKVADLVLEMPDMPLYHVPSYVFFQSAYCVLFLVCVVFFPCVVPMDWCVCVSFVPCVSHDFVQSVFVITVFASVS
jgi:hypothetical protein